MIPYPNTSPRHFLQPEDIARHLEVSKRTVIRWIEQGKLAALRIGNITRISLADYQQFLIAHYLNGDEQMAQRTLQIFLDTQSQHDQNGDKTPLLLAFTSEVPE